MITLLIWGCSNDFDVFLMQKLYCGAILYKELMCFICMYHLPAFLHVISLTVPSSTEAVGLNPFDDEDDEEEMPAEQPNSSPANVKKEEVVVKMLVNRKHLLLFCPCSLHIYFLLLCCLMPIIFVSFWLIYSSVLSFRCLLFPCMVAQCRWRVNKRMHTVLCVFSSTV